MNRNQKYESYFKEFLDDSRLCDSEVVPTSTTQQNCRRFKFKSDVDVPGMWYIVWFRNGGKVFTGLIIFPGLGPGEDVFNYLEKRKAEIHSGVGATLQWERHTDISPRQQYLLSGLSRNGGIEWDHRESAEIKDGQIETLLKLREILVPEIERALQMNNST